MSYSIHILRQTGDGQETPITLDEWNAYIDADSDLKRPEPGDPNFSDTAALLQTDGVGPGEWQSLRWITGSILSDYPQQSMLKKIGHIARHFNAVVVSDDGDVWRIHLDGRMEVVSLPTNLSDPNAQTSRKPLEERPGAIWRYFNYDEKTDPRRIIIWLLGCRHDADHIHAAKCIADGLQIPMEEASAAIHACESGTPVGLPGPEDIEELCGICERLDRFGIMVTACGVAVPPWK